MTGIWGVRTAVRTVPVGASVTACVSVHVRRAGTVRNGAGYPGTVPALRILIVRMYAGTVVRVAAMSLISCVLIDCRHGRVLEH